MMNSTAYPQHNRGFLAMNNKAVGLNFYHGDSQGASTILQEAVSELRQEMGAKLSATISCACSSMDASMASQFLEQEQDCCLPRICVQSVPLSNQVAQSLEGFDNGYGLTFFDRAFLITNQDERDLVVGNNEHKSCCILLYNIGVCHHLQALRTGARQHLAQALQLYRIALQFLKYAENNGAVRMMDDPSILAVSLALMNNIAHITSSVYDYDETRNCIAWLREAVDTFEIASLREQEDYRFFFLRYFVMPPHDVPQCAHAA